MKDENITIGDVIEELDSELCKMANTTKAKWDNLSESEKQERLGIPQDKISTNYEVPPRPGRNGVHVLTEDEIAKRDKYWDIIKQNTL